MRRPASRYHNLEGQNWQSSEPVRWYWRLLALVASWMILGGYLIFPAAYDTDPQLRFSNALLYVMVATLLSAGYASTLLLCFSCENTAFRSDSIFLPAMSSSALGLLTLLYQFASSRRYGWNAAATIATVVSLCATIAYAFLLVWSHNQSKKSAAVKETLLKPRAESPSPPASGSDPNLAAQTYTYYQNQFDPVAHAQPIASHSRNSSYSGAQPYRASALPVPSEDELVNQQMAMLLSKRDSGPSLGFDQQTFKIDLPTNRDEGSETPLDGSTLERMKFSRGVAEATGGRLSPRSDLDSHKTAPMLDTTEGLGVWEQVDRMQSAVGPSGKVDKAHLPALLPPQLRKMKSREDRRREIELGPQIGDEDSFR